MAEPFDAPSIHAIVACAFPGVAAVICGAPGSPGVTISEIAERCPSPIPLTSETWNVYAVLFAKPATVQGDPVQLSLV